jgi:hypothetical protein
MPSLPAFEPDEPSTDDADTATGDVSERASIVDGGLGLGVAPRGRRAGFPSSLAAAHTGGAERRRTIYAASASPTGVPSSTAPTSSAFPWVRGSQTPSFAVRGLLSSFPQPRRVGGSTDNWKGTP